VGKEGIMYGNIVLASTKNGFIPNAIKWFTQSQFSHSLVIIPEMLGIPMCIEAAESGVNTVRFDKNYINDVNEGYQVWSVKVGNSVKRDAIKSISNDLEIGYGFLQYPYFIVRRICLLFGKDIKSKNNWFSKDGMICSQLVVAYLTACGLSFVFEGYGLGSIAPQDLQNIFKVHPELFELVESVRL
jgi:hypothetical protein